jgi:outer membrane protein assembly factor BamB
MARGIVGETPQPGFKGPPPRGPRMARRASSRALLLALLLALPLAAVPAGAGVEALPGKLLNAGQAHVLTEWLRPPRATCGLLPGCIAWTTLVGTPASSFDEGDIVLAPDGSVAYAMGSYPTGIQGTKPFVLALDVATGAPRWTRTIDETAVLAAMALAPDGRTLVVAGHRSFAGTFEDAIVLALDAATGEPRWLQRWNGPASRYDVAFDLAFDPAGERLHVAGAVDSDWIARDIFGGDLLAMALDPGTGTVLWANRWDAGPPYLGERGSHLVVARDRVLVAGATRLEPAQFPLHTNIVLAAFDAANGALLGAGVRSRPERERIEDVALSPDGATLHAAGWMQPLSGGATRARAWAFDVATGAPRWEHTLPQAEGEQHDERYQAIAVHGATLVATGTGADCHTTALDLAGRMQWDRVPNAEATRCHDVAFAPDGATVYVAADRRLFTTPTLEALVHAYATASGHSRWRGTAETPAQRGSVALVPTPDGAAVLAAAVPGHVIAFDAGDLPPVPS